MIQFFQANPWLKDYQTLASALIGLIASFIGFSALLIGYLVNARLNRRQLDRNRQQEAVSIAAILAAEINGIAAFARVAAKVSSELKDDGNSTRFFEVALPNPHYFETVKEKIGLLGPSLAMKVTNFYVFCFQATPKHTNLAPKDATAEKTMMEFGHSSAALARIDALSDDVVPELIAFTFGRYQPPKDISSFLDTHSSTPPHTT